jgi:hypothetical protein
MEHKQITRKKRLNNTNKSLNADENKTTKHYQKVCLFCGEKFLAKREYAKYCSSKCRQKTYKEKHEEVQTEKRRQVYIRENKSIGLYGWLLLIAGGLLLFLAIYPSYAGEYALIFVYYGGTAITVGGALVFISIIFFIMAKS